jgi:thiamine biosynthesis lipoprotein
MKQLAFFCSVVFLFACQDNHKETFYSLQGQAFGTGYSIQYYSKSTFSAERGIDSVVQVINQSVSTYLADSDISKINRGDTTVVVDPIFRDVFRLSEEVFNQTEGYFDPTVGVLRNAYGFGEEAPIKQIDSVTIDSLLQYVGFQKVRITAKNTIAKQFPQIYFDFNAIAKGYGIDQIGAYLEQQGVTDYLIELGGELLAKGIHKDKGKPWTVGIEAVTSALEDRTYDAVIALRDRAMASSGNYRKFWVDSLSGRKYVHTINPLTGSAEKSDVTSATVLAPTCALADAYATACMAMGLEKSKAVLQQLPNIEAYLTFNDENGSPQVYATPGFTLLR